MTATFLSLKHFLLIVLLLVLTACSPAASTPEPAGPTIPLEDCLLSAPGQGQAQAECGWLEVPEDPAAPEGRKIALRIALVRAVSRAPSPDPIVLLAGGPGQAASEAFVPMLPSLERLRFRRDLLLVDQRGTGQSAPLDCPQAEISQEVAGLEPPLEEQLDLLRDCRAGLQADPRFYTTENAMADLDAVRQALGYEQLNLLGVSYGTRAALTYLQLFPEHTRSLILDGVVPPDWPLGAQVAADAQRSLDLIFARCQTDPACAEQFPDLAGRFSALMAEVEDATLEVTVTHPRSGAPAQVQINPASLGITVRLMSYSDLLAALLPLAIHQASAGDYRLLASQYLMLVEGLDESMSTGMNFSVLCTEDVPFLPEGSPDGDFYLEFSLDDLRESCQVWLPEPVGGELSGPPASDVPVLLISGEADPVTPPANGEAVAALLPNSLHIVLPGLGHNNFYVGCMPNLLRTFLDTLEPRDLDSTCTQSIHPQSFFLSPLGPQP